jgi:hypothetical protein
MNAKPFGHSARVRRRKYGSAEIVEQEIHRRGPRSAVVRAAKMLVGFQAIEEVEAFTEAEWLRVFGDGTEHGSYRRKG